MEDKEDSMDAAKDGVVGETDLPNPLKKLIAGFCSPQKMTNVSKFEEDGEENIDNQYEPELRPVQDEKSKIIQEPPTAEPITSDSGNAPTVDKPATITTENATSESSAENGADQESLPEDDVSKKVIANRRKRGIENFVMACIFVLATLLSLKKLGFTTSDFDFSTSGGGSGSSSWIHVVDEAPVEGQVKVEPVDAIDETSLGETAMNQVDEDDNDNEAKDSLTEEAFDEL